MEMAFPENQIASGTLKVKRLKSGVSGGADGVDGSSSAGLAAATCRGGHPHQRAQFRAGGHAANGSGTLADDPAAAGADSRSGSGG
mgnify:CR=1 FL=1